jgi:hypothetical protein
MISRVRSMTRWLLCRLPPLRDWIAEVDRQAGDSRRWQADQIRRIAGSKREQAAILDLLSCLTPRQVAGFDKVRLGRDGDGGYVMLNDFAEVSAALSFGINDDCSWDTDIARRGIDVYQYDHTVDGPPTPNARFRFFKKRIAAEMSEQSETLGSALAKLPAPDVGHTILKIDIEGSEWEVFDSTTIEQLARFSQVVGEFHGFSNALDASWRDTAHRVMSKLRSVFEVVHVHGNNHAPFAVVANIAIPESIELTFANRTIYTCQETDEVFPTPIDQPNWEGHPDIFLGSVRFK